MNTKKSVSLLGCCVVRDTFGVHEEEGGYIINPYVQIPNPVSLVTKSPLYDVNAEIDDEIFEGKRAFIKKCQILELRKQVFQYMWGGVTSDYFLLDCGEFRKNILYFPETDGWFTEGHKDLLEKYIERGLVPEKYEVIRPLEMDRTELYSYLRKFCDELLHRFDREHIILLETKFVEFHTDGKCIQAFRMGHEGIEKNNIQLKLCYDYVKSYLHGCHIVEFPKGVIADTNHKWLKHYMHYVPEYYDYSLKAVDIITQNAGGRPDEEKSLEVLKHTYEKLFQEKHDVVLRSTLDLQKKKNMAADKMLKYEQFFKKILLEDGREKIKEVLEERGVRTCAFYGKTRITEVFLAWFRSWGIGVEYVVENYSKVSVWMDIPLIKRTDENLLNCTNMIICDIRYEAIKDKLVKWGFTGTIFNYNEFI